MSVRKRLAAMTDGISRQGVSLRESIRVFEESAARYYELLFSEKSTVDAVQDQSTQSYTQSDRFFGRWLSAYGF